MNHLPLPGLCGPAKLAARPSPHFRLSAVGSALLLLAALLVGCSPPVEPTPDGKCSSNLDCPGNKVCRDGKCIDPGTGDQDASSPDDRQTEPAREAAVDVTPDSGGPDGREPALPEPEPPRPDKAVPEPKPDKPEQCIRSPDLGP